uniref:Ig-like domain-containing protein n=1 Tax=Neolamprologus brichardi TaxID=32507 RepID=A0A3Q4I8V9_NEOBR
EPHLNRLTELLSVKRLLMNHTHHTEYHMPFNTKIIPAQSGQNITLPCRAPNNNIIVVEWSRADLGDEYVLLYRDEQFDPENQHPSFKNRVDLQDRQMKDGDVSLILKNVTINDSGNYECRVFMKRSNRRKRAHLKTNPISIIYLSVVDPPGDSTLIPLFVIKVIKKVVIKLYFCYKCIQKMLS